MDIRHYKKYLLCFGLVFILILGSSFTNIGMTAIYTANEDETLLEVQEKISSITEEEKKILERLFLLSQEIEEMDTLNTKLSKEISELNEEVTKLEKMIQVETQKYEKNLSVLEKVLKAYQKNGPGSYVELILSSDSLTTLIERINILGDISKNTSKLLEAIKESKEKLALEKAKLSDKLALIEEQQRKLTEAIENKIGLKNDLEAYLVSLEGEQQKYEEYLSNINKLWSGIKPLFSETVKAFSRMMMEADIPPDAIEIELSLFSIKGVIKEKTFNEIIRSQEFPTKMEFGFSSDRMTVQMPDKRLSLSGTFVVLDGQKLVFEVDKGTFFEMPLESSAIEELFKEGYLELDLKPILGKNIIKSIKINEENIELKITPVLF